MTVCLEEDCESTKLKARGLCVRHYKPGYRLPPQSLTPAELDRLVAAADGPRWTDKRNVALIQLLASSGLRIDEALSLTPEDVDWSEAPKVTLFVAHGKGDKARSVGLGIQAHKAVQAWLTVSDGMRALFPPGSPLFPSGTGRKMDDSQVRRLFRRLGKKAGITKRVHPHGLRHTFAVKAAKARKRPELIQRQLGHSNLGTTTRYLSTINPSEVVDEMQDL